jgi:DNA-binding MurR/RpiR family transcriptional regulator
MQELMIHADDDFLARLAAVRGRLSPKMAHLAAYVSEHYVQVAFMSTRELAAAAGVSFATVVRLPAALGYATFDAMRTGLQDRINFDLTAVERLQTLPDTHRTPSVRLRHIVETDIANLRALAHTFSEPQLEQFVGGILAAERVTIFGFRYVSPLALYFEYSLAKIWPQVRAFLQADSALYERVRQMDERDVLVVLTFARYPTDLVKLVRYAHGRGLRILAITDSPLSPVLPFADAALFAKAAMLDVAGSLAAPAALINCLVGEISARLGPAALERLRANEEVAAAADIYVHAGSAPPSVTHQPAPAQQARLGGPGRAGARRSRATE